MQPTQKAQLSQLSTSQRYSFKID